jgi:hypothetical protein
MTNIPYITAKARFIKMIVIGLISSILTAITVNLAQIVPESYQWSIPLLTTILTATGAYFEKYNKEQKKIDYKQKADAENQIDTEN